MSSQSQTLTLARRRAPSLPIVGEPYRLRRGIFAAMLERLAAQPGSIAQGILRPLPRVKFSN